MKDNSIPFPPNVRFDLKNVSTDIIKLQLRMKAKATSLFSGKTNERDRNLWENLFEAFPELPGKQILDNRIVP